ncbi:hypothetical protein ACFQE8_08700 [Salinirubellus sp. GCM10025818]|uniref:DUF6414 family protein n=1 Tax=Salinirubellus TaxID=2162630 RepID=UPI0030D6167C
MGELREFVYIDDESLNSNLSSLGRGVPSEIIQSSEGETEKAGQAGGTIWGIGAKGKYAGIDRNTIETTLQITAPYRFQDLLNALEENDIEIHHNPDPRSVARGDVVRIEGQAKPMSLFKFEVTLKTIRELLNQQTQQSLEELDDAEIEEDVDLAQLDVIQELIEHFTGSTLPLRVVTDDAKYGVALDREKMRLSPSRAFLNEQEYTLFGRVDQRILADSSWDPILATKILNRYLPEDSSSEEMRESLEEVAREINLSMEAEDWELTGHTATIHPIVLFW